MRWLPRSTSYFIEASNIVILFQMKKLLTNIGPHSPLGFPMFCLLHFILDSLSSKREHRIQFSLEAVQQRCFTTKREMAEF